MYDFISVAERYYSNGDKADAKYKAEALVSSWYEVVCRLKHVMQRRASSMPTLTNRSRLK